jgi:hypothetical protein
MLKYWIRGYAGAMMNGFPVRTSPIDTLGPPSGKNPSPGIPCNKTVFAFNLLTHHNNSQRVGGASVNPLCPARVLLKKKSQSIGNSKLMWPSILHAFLLTPPLRGNAQFMRYKSQSNLNPEPQQNPVENDLSLPSLNRASHPCSKHCINQKNLS